MMAETAKASSSSSAKYLLLGLVIVGLGLRIASFRFNDLPHGDVHLDYDNAYTFSKTGRLITPLVWPRSYVLQDWEHFGYPQDQHPPLWPIMGGLLTTYTSDAYVSLKLMTLLIGTLLIPLSYFATRKAYGHIPALLTAGFLTFSYLMIDYSGNGAFYVGQAATYLVFVWLCATPERPLNAVLLGLTVAIAYLLNYQAVILVLALILVHLVQYLRHRRLRMQLVPLALGLGVAALLVAPWLVRNYLLFGSPLFNTNSGYLLSNLGIGSSLERIGDAYVSSLDWASASPSHMLRQIMFWTARNLAYMSARLLILAPVLALFSALGIILVVRRRSELGPATWVAVIVLLLHALISILWPVFKFRYFVPLLPLVVALGAWGLTESIRGMRTRLAFIAIAAAGLLLVGVATYLRVPSHTNYYDSNELIRWRTGEAEWYASESLFKEAAGTLNGDAASDVAIMSEHAGTFYFTHRPIVILAGSAVQPEVVSFYVEQYDIQYIIAEAGRESLYAGILPVSIFHENDGYVVLEVKQDKDWPE